MSETIDKEYLALIVSNLLDGMNVSRVPEPYLGYLFEPLAEEQSKAMKSGRKQTVIRIQNIVKEINSLISPYHEEQQKSVTSRSSSRSSKSSKKSKQAKKVEEEVKEKPQNINSVFTSAPTTATLQDIIAILEIDKTRAVNEGNYKQAQSIYDIIHSIKQQIYQTPEKISNAGNYLSIERKIADFEDNLEELKDYYNNQRKTLLQMQKDSESDLKNYHQQQIEDFKETWPTELPAPYRKVSKTVLSIRDQEKKLIFLNRYDDAIAYKKRADYLEKKEIDAQREKFNDEYRRSLNQMRSSQKREMSVLKTKWKTRLDELNYHAKKDIENRQRVLDLLKSKLAMSHASRLMYIPSPITDYEPKSTDGSKLQRDPWKY